jgi:hypothetical protein
VVAAVSGHHHPSRNTAGKTIDVTLAVHIADRLEHEARAKRENPSLETGDSIDEDLSDWSELLPEWRETAERFVEKRGST